MTVRVSEVLSSCLAKKDAKAIGAFRSVFCLSNFRWSIISTISRFFCYLYFLCYKKVVC